MLRIFKKSTVNSQQSTDNGQQTLCTVPEPVEGNSSAFSASLREVFLSQQDYKTTRLQVLVRSEVENLLTVILLSNILLAKLLLKSSIGN